MKRLTIAMAFALATLPGMLQAQSVQSAPATQTVTVPSLRDQLMPAGSAAALTAPAVAAENETLQPNQPVMQRRGAGTGLMIAGAALFIGGLVIGGDAGTAVAVAGAAIGAYGLYVYFQ
jgi:hypothetical protein